MARRDFFRVQVLPIVLIAALSFLPDSADARTPWRNGDIITFNQADYGVSIGDVLLTTGVRLLLTKYEELYGFARVEVGIVGTDGFSILFLDSLALALFLPQTGTPGPLTQDVIEPRTTPAGSFGGDVMALKLNIDFADAGFLRGAKPIRFGDLTLCGFGQIGQVAGLAQLNGRSVREFSSIANTLLGGGTFGGGILELTAADIAPVIADLNGSFGAGLVTLFATEHLVIPGACAR